MSSNDLSTGDSSAQAQRPWRYANQKSTQTNVIDDQTDQQENKSVIPDAMDSQKSRPVAVVAPSKPEDVIRHENASINIDTKQNDDKNLSEGKISQSQTTNNETSKQPLVSDISVASAKKDDSDDSLAFNQNNMVLLMAGMGLVLMVAFASLPK